MGEEETKGYKVEIPDDAVQQALESIDRKKKSPDQEEETVVQVEVETEPEPEAPARAEGGEGPSREQLVDLVQKLREEARAARDRMLRIAADADNTRKRALKERQEGIKFGLEALLRDLLVPLDNLERTLVHIPAESFDTQQAFEAHREGLKMVVRMFADTLEKHHLKSFGAAPGEKFDPGRHEALHRVETTEHEADTVVEELQRGYLLHDRLLRPALVAVACAPGETESCADTGAESAAEETENDPNDASDEKADPSG